MTELKIFLVMLFVHWFADFVLQSDAQAKGKSQGKSFWNKQLFHHVATYTAVWALVYFLLPFQEIYVRPVGWFIFVLLIGVPHYVTDWITSRIGKVYWDRGDAHNGFCVVGLDQIIHYVSLLFVMYGMLIVK